VAVKTPLRPSESTSDLLRESFAPMGHTQPAPVGRGRIIWSLIMLLVLVAALVIGIVLQSRSSSPTGEGDWVDQIEVPAASTATGDWMALVV
jgi:hypothetical protein